MRAQPSFEERCLGYVKERHSHLTVAGLDLSRPERARWPLDAAYLSLELAERRGLAGGEERGRPSVTVKRAEHALAGCRRVLLRGLAGSGKTRLLQWLAVAAAGDELPEELADWRGRVPFVLPLRTLVRRGPLPEPGEFLSSVGAPLAAAQPEGWADGLLARGEALVLVDGIDEVPQEHRGATRNWLERLLAAYGDARFVVTTRPSAVPEGWLAPAHFTELSVWPMSTGDIGVFVHRWHVRTPPSCEPCSAVNRMHSEAAPMSSPSPLPDGVWIWALCSSSTLAQRLTQKTVSRPCPPSRPGAATARKSRCDPPAGSASGSSCKAPRPTSSRSPYHCVCPVFPNPGNPALRLPARHRAPLRRRSGASSGSYDEGAYGFELAGSASTRTTRRTPA
ncbi:NACHT domain-containing protein [Streptomyces sp. NPDC057244]